jgi:hypothetical protein
VQVREKKEAFFKMPRTCHGQPGRFKIFRHFAIPWVDPDPIAISSQDIAMLDIEVIKGFGQYLSGFSNKM